jgi:lactate dehydrogenase-like 2-hydroxyacid dehydrogenase
MLTEEFTMSRPEVLVIWPIRPEQMAELDRTYTLHRYDEATDKEAFLQGKANAVRAVVTTGGHGFNADLLTKLPNLEVVGSSGVGVDKIDVAACRARNVFVTNTPDVLNDDVADLGFGLVIACMREMPQGFAYVRSGDWGRQGMMHLTTTLSGKTIGIVGLGRIGREIADRARAFKMKVAYTGRTKQDVPFTYISSLMELARQSDVLMLTIPGGPATNNLVDREVLEALGPEGWLINMSRGSVVDEPALIAALKSGTIRGAGLDVYWNEPNVEPELVALPNVVHYPHHSSGTVETRGAMSQLVVDNLAAHFAGRPLLTPV